MQLFLQRAPEQINDQNNNYKYSISRLGTLLGRYAPGSLHCCFHIKQCSIPSLFLATLVALQSTPYPCRESHWAEFRTVAFDHLSAISQYHISFFRDNVLSISFIFHILKKVGLVKVNVSWFLQSWSSKVRGKAV